MKHSSIHYLVCIQKYSILTLAVDSTAILEPKTLILSVSIGVFATRIFAFSIRFGWFTPIFFSKIKPAKMQITMILQYYSVANPQSIDIELSKDIIRTDGRHNANA